SEEPSPPFRSLSPSVATAVYSWWAGPEPGSSMKIGSVEIPELCRLAPMAAISNAPVRLIAKACGSGLTTTEDIDAFARVTATARLLRAMRQSIAVPFTIKIRGGWDDEHLNAVEVARMAEGEGIDAITVHPRTRSQRFTGKAPWTIIAEVVQAVRIPVTGNGDVHSTAEARRMVAETGCQSVMIGRGALGSPWIFDEGFDVLSS